MFEAGGGKTQLVRRFSSVRGFNYINVQVAGNGQVFRGEFLASPFARQRIPNVSAGFIGRRTGLRVSREHEVV